MVSIDEVAAIALALDEVTEGVRYGNRSWMVNGKTFVWERPFTKADVKRFGDAPVPEGVILGVSVEDQIDKQAVIASNPKAFFNITHLDGYNAYLIQLNKVTNKQLTEALLDAWLVCAPARLTEKYLK
ncbi:MAG: hypothetical protein Q7K25_03565 [Actinomycetota bacterium]|nr:hypothetical protein [Actinomycetota bacterium]